MATSYANDMGTGNRLSKIKVASTPAFSGSGFPGRLVDGSMATSGSGSVFFTGGLSAMDIEFDFGPSSRMVIQEITWYQNTTSSHGTWQWQGWNGSGWDNLGGTFTLGGATTQVITAMSAVTADYRLFRLHHTGAGGNTSSSPWLQEIEFKLEDVGLAPTSVGHAKGSGARDGGLVGVSTTATLGAGTANNIVDGAFVADLNDAFWMNGGQSGRQFVFDFFLPVILDKLTWYQSNGPSTHGVWRLAGSNDGITEHEVLLQIAGDAGSDDFTLGGALANLYLFEDTASGTPNPGFRYYLLTQQSGTVSATPYIQEVEFSLLNASGGPPPSGGKIPVMFICN